MKQSFLKKHHPAWTRILPACCILVFLTLGFGNNVTGLFLQVVSVNLGLSYAQLSFSITIQGIVTLLAVMVVGKILYRVDTRIVMSTAIILISGCYGLLAIARSVYHWWLASAVIAFAGAFVSIFAVSLVLSEWFHSGYGLALGICTAFSGLSGAILNPLVNQMITNYGWRIAYVVNGGIILVAGLPVTLFMLRLRPDDLHEKPFGDAAAILNESSTAAPDLTVSKLLLDARFFVILVGSVAVASFYMINQHIVSIGSQFNLSGNVCVQAVTLQMLTITLFRILGNLWLDRGGGAKVCCIYFSAGIIGMILLLAVQNVTPALFYTAVFLYAIGASVLLTIIPIWVRTAFGVKNYVKIYPFYYNVFSIVMSFGSSIAGALYEAHGNYSSVFLIVLCGFSIAAVSAIVLQALQARKER